MSGESTCSHGPDSASHSPTAYAEGYRCSLPLDNPVYREIVVEFATDLKERLRKMREALATNDLDTLRRLAHSLKGSAGSFGYHALTDPCARLEDAAKRETGNYEALLEAVESVAGALELPEC